MAVVSTRYTLSSCEYAYTFYPSQDNRAVTVKDLGVLCMKYGLVCQKCVMSSLAK